jgi:hypothetical protein
MRSLIVRRLGAALVACVAWGMAPQSSAGAPLREALGHFESGATSPVRCSADNKVGSRKEVSRFQILPNVWRQYSKSGEYRNPDVAWTVVEKILTDRYTQFTRATGREWDGVDLYIMWNAPGVYEKARWDRRKVSKIVLERAYRFNNLLLRDQMVAGNP